MIDSTELEEDLKKLKENTTATTETTTVTTETSEVNIHHLCGDLSNQANLCVCIWAGVCVYVCV